MSAYDAYFAGKLGNDNGKSILNNLAKRCEKDARVSCSIIRFPAPSQGY